MVNLSVDLLPTSTAEHHGRATAYATRVHAQQNKRTFDCIRHPLLSCELCTAGARSILEDGSSSCLLLGSKRSPRVQ